MSRKVSRNGRYTPPKGTAYVGPEIAEDSSEFEKERAARRRLVATTGRCPCGGRLVIPPLVPGTLNMMAVEHEPDCPAVD